MAKSSRPEVIDTVAGYLQELAVSGSNRLVNLEQVEPAYRLAVAYADADNVIGRKLYELPAAFMRLMAAEALAAAHREFRRLGYGICIFDGYRPYSVTCELWDAFRDPRYVADPAEGSRHNRGCSVDMTLYELESGRFLEMPTGYDDFSEKAHHACQQLSPGAIANRQLLKTVMTDHQFRVFDTEWWHYDFCDWQDYSLLDIPFAELQLLEDS